MPLSMLLDVVEVPKSHSGANLAIMFAEVLKTLALKKRYELDNLKLRTKKHSPSCRFSV
jgi:hypothetical protein